jgi:hypothetical protein
MLSGPPTGTAWREAPADATLLDLFAAAMDQLERINPPTG